MLNEQRRIQLDNIVKQMMVNGEKENTKKQPERLPSAHSGHFT